MYIKQFLFSNKEDHDNIEVSQWYNGEGFDVSINTKNDSKHISFTHGQFDLIKELIIALECEEI